MIRRACTALSQSALSKHNRLLRLDGVTLGYQRASYLDATALGVEPLSGQTELVSSMGVVGFDAMVSIVRVWCTKWTNPRSVDTGSIT